MNLNITLEGMDGVKAALEQLTSGEHMQNALERAGEVVRSDAAGNCPVRTGRLAGSITSTVEGNTAVIGTNVEYGIYVEFGTGSKGDPSVAHRQGSWKAKIPGVGWRYVSGQAAQPFLVPALKNNVSQIIQAFKEGYGG